MFHILKKLLAMLALTYGLVFFSSGAIAQETVLESEEAEKEEYCNPNLHDCGW